MKIISSKPVSVSNVSKILEDRAKDGELGYEQQSALEYCQNFSKIPIKEEKKLIEELMKNEKISIETAIKLVDLAPKSPDLVKAILIKESIDLNEEEIEKIVKLFSK